MRLLRALTRRMVVKIFLATALLVGLAIGVLAWVQVNDQVAGMKRATEDSALKIADLVSGSLEHAMLQGDGINVKELVRGFKRRVPDADIRIYDKEGQEVFGEPAPAPPASEIPPPLARALREGARFVDGGHVYRPIPNEERCHDCHDPEPPLRGVLTFTRDEVALATRREELATELVRAGFMQIMSARQAKRLDDYFTELSQLAPTILAVGVYDREGDLAFGRDARVPQEVIMAALQPGAAQTRVAVPGGAVQLVPLPRQERCGQCHKDQAPVRGVLAVALAELPEGSRAAEQELEVVVDASLRAIMMSSLGRIIADYLRQVAKSGAVGELTLYDARGAVWFTSSPPPPSDEVARALGAAEVPPMLLAAGGAERVMLSRRLVNGPKCQTCHGADHEVRGVVLVSLPNDGAMKARADAMLRTLVVAGGAIALVLLMLYALGKVLIDRPVREIGRSAEAVGQGDLSIEVRSADPEGDELARLGSRINEMIVGLRTKFVLEKFVSKGAAKAAETSAFRAASLTTPASMRAAARGERRHLAVLFTDIRGFTAYSETVSPEQVVEMLNAFLQAQVEVVERWQGDIDKFVGDEIVAVFQGEDASRRAVRCAVEMIEAVERSRRPDQALAVGAGVSCGDVVYGPIGAAQRLDFTVIGDVVNTGARLCGAAAGGQVLVTRQVVDDCRGGLGDIEFNALEPMKVKNKREPLEVYSATRVR